MSDMCQSLNIKDNIDAIFESGERSGNSGSFFFFSKDKKFVVKTMRFNEKAILLSMLDKMYQHFLETQNKSIIAKIYGLYSIKSNFFDEVTIYVMQNTLKNENEMMLFDLKGSLYKRIVPFKEKWWNTKKSHKKCMKDLNYLEIMRSKKEAIDIDNITKLELETII
jgi:1-phosphatidylinositol-4-phosphate 5-kinase